MTRLLRWAGVYRSHDARMLRVNCAVHCFERRLDPFVGLRMRASEIVEIAFFCSACLPSCSEGRMFESPVCRRTEVRCDVDASGYSSSLGFSITADLMAAWVWAFPSTSGSHSISSLCLDCSRDEYRYFRATSSIVVMFMR